MTVRFRRLGDVQDGRMPGIGTGPGAITKDGCPVEVYAALSPRLHEVGIVQQFLAPGGSVLELGAGTGLIAEPLAESGYRAVAVDNSAEMLTHLRRATPVCGDIEGIDLDERFDVVLLASHLVNTPDAEVRQRFLAAAARHVKPSGRVLMEWHPPEWFDGLAVGIASQGSLDGFLIELLVHDLSEGVLSATVNYRRAGQEWTQTFRARRLAWAELSAALHGVGLDLSITLTEDGRWVSAGPWPSVGSDPKPPAG